MDGIYNRHGVHFPTKKALREAIGGPVEIEPTSMFGDGTVKLPYSAAIVGPDPYTSRKWYAQVEIDAGGILRRVK